MSQEPVASFIICDDIRTEVTGKAVLVGVYASNIMVPKLPVKLPKLVFLAKLRSSIEDPHHWMIVRIDAPGAEPFVSEKIELRGKVPVGEGEQGVQFIESSHQIELSPFEIKEKGRIRIWIQSDKGEHYAGSIPVQTAEDSPASSLPIKILQVGAIGLAFYSKMRDELGKDRVEGLAVSIADFVADNISSEALQLMPKDEDCRVQISPNRFVVFFAQPREEVPAVTILDLPEGARAEFMNVDQFGFSVTITPTEAVPEDLKFTAD